MITGKKILFCRSGGGLPGLDIHCGIWRALAKAGIVATDCIGTSAGAVIGALDSAGYAAEAVARIVASLADGDIIRERFAWKARFMWLDHICAQAPIRARIEELLAPYTRLEKSFTAVTTRAVGGMRVDWFFSKNTSLFSQDPAFGQIVEVLLASMAISGIFPWVKINGFDYTDGGTRANLPLPGNWQKHYDEVWLLVASRPLDYRKRYTNALSRLLLNLDLYASDQLLDVFDQVRPQRPPPFVRIVWPNVFSQKSVLKFDHSLIAAAEADTNRILSEGRFL